MGPEEIKALTNISQYGLLGSLFVLAVLGGFWLLKALLAEKEKRILDAKEDTKQMMITLDKTDDTIKALIVAIENKNDSSKH